MVKKLTDKEIGLLAYLIADPESKKEGIDMSDFSFMDNLGETLKDLVKSGYIKVDSENQKMIINLD